MTMKMFEEMRELRKKNKEIGKLWDVEISKVGNRTRFEFNQYTPLHKTTKNFKCIKDCPFALSEICLQLTSKHLVYTDAQFDEVSLIEGITSEITQHENCNGVDVHYLIVWDELFSNFMLGMKELHYPDDGDGPYIYGLKIIKSYVPFMMEVV